MYIVLIGFMGTGKSAVGRALARRLSGRLIDTDSEIERQFCRSIPNIFAKDGEAAFREAETKLLQGLVLESESAGASKSTKVTVVSTGGGTPLRSENAELLRKLGSVVLLDAIPDVILARVSHNLNNRPLLAGSDLPPLQRIKLLLSERRPRYISAANHIINTSHSARPDDVARRIIRALRLPEQPANA